MPNGCTPLDFAYYIHSQVGHRCIGAKINDRIVPFTYKLQTGEQVEILTSKLPNPKRDWLNSRMGYIYSSRSRAKIQNFFKQQDRDKNLHAGREMLEAELATVSLKLSDTDIALRRYNLNTREDLIAAVGCGDVRINSLVNFLQAQLKPTPKVVEQVIKKVPPSRKKNKSEVVVEGVGNLLTHMAKCCQPIPGDDIDGFITQGKGISVHQRECEQLKESLNRHPERNVEVNWGDDSSNSYVLNILVLATNRTGLVHDITAIIANEKVSLLGMNTDTNDATLVATIALKLEVSGHDSLARVMTKLDSVESVFGVKRK